MFIVIDSINTFPNRITQASGDSPNEEIKMICAIVFAAAKS